MYHQARGFFHLVLLQSLLPVTLTYILLKFVTRFFVCRSLSPKFVVGEENDDGHVKHYTVVLTGGKMSKSLHLARCLKSFARHSNQTRKIKIVMLESRKFRFCASRFSRCVDHFEVITSPRESPEAYQNDIYHACVKYNATHFLPVAAPVEAVYDAKLKPRLENIGIEVLHMDTDLCSMLDDKHKFGTFLAELGIHCPQTFQVDSDAEAFAYNERFLREKPLLPLVLKNLQYDPIHRLDLFQLPITRDKLEKYLRKIKVDGNPITPSEPWQLQEFLDGPEYAAMIFVRDNKLLGMTACPSSPSQLNYVHEECAAIGDWVNSFLKGLEYSKYTLTGQICFDFIIVQKGMSKVAFPIECNPRVHTQCTSFNTERCTALLGSLLLEPNEKRSNHLAYYINDEYKNNPHLNVYWLYNEWFKIFPNSWLLAYNPDNDIVERLELANEPLQFSFKRILILLVYFPSFIISGLISLPVLLTVLCSLLVSRKSITTSNFFRMSWKHSKVILCKFLAFLDRLIDTETNVEPDFCIYDPLPLFAKNHIQVPLRLLATIRTGVEWKKIDFAIGKVVEVGGD